MSQIITAADAVDGVQYLNQKGQPFTCRGAAAEPGYFAMENQHGVMIPVHASYQLTTVEADDPAVLAIAQKDPAKWAPLLASLTDEQLDELTGHAKTIDGMRAVQAELRRRDEGGEELPPEPKPKPAASRPKHVVQTDCPLCRNFVDLDRVGRESYAFQFHNNRDGEQCPMSGEDTTLDPSAAEAVATGVVATECAACGKITKLRQQQLGEDGGEVFVEHPGRDGVPLCSGSGHTPAGVTHTAEAAAAHAEATAEGQQADEDYDDRADGDAAYDADTAEAALADTDGDGLTLTPQQLYEALDRDVRVAKLHESVRVSRESLKLETDVDVINDAIAAEHKAKGRATIGRQLSARVVKLGGTPWTPDAAKVKAAGDAVNDGAEALEEFKAKAEEAGVVVDTDGDAEHGPHYLAGNAAGVDGFLCDPEGRVGQAYNDYIEGYKAGQTERNALEALTPEKSDEERLADIQKLIAAADSHEDWERLALNHAEAMETGTGWPPALKEVSDALVEQGWIYNAETYTWTLRWKDADGGGGAVTVTAPGHTQAVAEQLEREGRRERRPPPDPAETSSEADEEDPDVAKMQRLLREVAAALPAVRRLGVHLELTIKT
jgi:hypothetical protein